MDWQPIETAPKNRERVWVKRVHDGRVVKEGWAVWGIMALDAPMRQWGDGGLGDPIPPDNAYADEECWLNEDRRHRFPTPTHWAARPQP